MTPTTTAEAASFFEYVYRGWPLFLGMIGSLAWLLRLEAKVVYLEKYTKDLSDQVSKRDVQMWTALNDMQKDIRNILQALSKIEGKLESNSKNH